MCLSGFELTFFGIGSGEVEALSFDAPHRFGVLQRQ